MHMTLHAPWLFGVSMTVALAGCFGKGFDLDHLDSATDLPAGGGKGGAGAAVDNAGPGDDTVPPLDAPLGTGGVLASGGTPQTGGTLALGTGGIVTGTGGMSGSGGIAEATSDAGPTAGATSSQPGTGGIGTGGILSTGGSAGTTNGSGGSSSADAGGCSPGSRRCDSDTLLTCDDNRSWPAVGETCDFVCRDNACTGQCKPGETSCTGNSVKTCDDNGKWPATGTACATGFTCDTQGIACVCNLSLCGNQCVDTTADPMRCGSCDRACPGKCSSGACQCATQSVANLIPDGGFDATALTDWTPGALRIALSRSTLDSADCPSSGALHISDQSGATGYYPNSGPCVAVTTGTTYNVGAWAYVPSSGPRATAEIQFSFRPDAACSQVMPYPGAIFFHMPEVYDVWQYVHQEDVVLPAGTTAVSVEASAVRKDTGTTEAMHVYFDSIYVSASPGRF